MVCGVLRPGLFVMVCSDVPRQERVHDESTSDPDERVQKFDANGTSSDSVFDSRPTSDGFHGEQKTFPSNRCDQLFIITSKNHSSRFSPV